MKADFQFESVVCNLGESRREVLNGREYIVAPATLIVGDSVLNGSDGPGLYPKEDVTADPEAWNGMPLVVRHPVDETGNHVSARDPKILNEWGIGNFYRSEVDGSNQKGEAWFDVLNVKAVDARLVEQGSNPILPHLESKQPLELSTGLRPNKVQKAGMSLNGDRYTWVAKQPYRPDHVAVFPPGEERGACSIRDGCGVNNAVSQRQTIWQKLGQMLGIVGNASTLPSSGIESEKACQILKDGSINGEPLTDAQRGMFGAACGQTGNTDSMTCPKCGTEMVNGKCPECGYEKSTTNGESDMPLTKSQRAKMVHHLTTNCKCKTKPEVLNAMDDEQLEAVHNGMTLKLVVNAMKGNNGRLKPTVNAEGEGEAVPGVPWPKLAQLLGIDIDPRADPVGFTSAMKTALDAISGKLGGEAPAPEPPADDSGESPVMTNIDGEDCEGVDNDDPECKAMFRAQDVGNRRRTVNRRTATAQLDAETRQDLAYIRNQRKQEKVEIVRELIRDVPTANKQAAGDTYFKLSLDQLKALRPAQVQNRQQPQPANRINWALNGGMAEPVANEELDAEYQRIAEQMTVNCGVGQQAAAKTA